MSRDRIDYLDLFKGIGIILMIAGHMSYTPILDKIVNRVGFGIGFDQFIHSFHMPMFFFVSGFLGGANHNRKLNYISQKSKVLLIPYICWGLISYLLWLIIHWDEKSAEPLLRLFSINSSGLPISGALWFLTAFWGTSLICLYLNEIPNRFLKLSLIIVISFLGIALGKMDIRLPFSFDVSLVGVGFVFAGTLAGGLFHRLTHKKPIWVLLLAVALFVGGTLLSGVNGEVNMRKAIYQNPILFFLNAMLMSFSILLLCFLLDQHLGKLLLCRIITYIGSGSSVYLCINQIILFFVEQPVSKLSVPSYICRILILTASVTVMVLVHWVAQKTSLGLLFGLRKAKR